MFTPVSSKSLTNSGERTQFATYCSVLSFAGKANISAVASIFAQTNLSHSTFSNWWKLCTVRMNVLHTSRKRSARVLCLMLFCLELFLHLQLGKKQNTLFTGLGSVRIKKNCALGLKCTDRGRVHSRPRAQCFSIRTSQPVNNIYVIMRWTVYRSLLLISYKYQRTR